jgi:hypothetical protein
MYSIEKRLSSQRYFPHTPRALGKAQLEETYGVFQPRRRRGVIHKEQNQRAQNPSALCAKNIGELLRFRLNIFELYFLII